MWPVPAELPETLQFLHAGWWALHVFAITTVGIIGYLIGRRRHRTEDKGSAYLPELYRFYQIGWWITHLAAIPLVFIIGFLVGIAYWVAG